MDVARSAHHRRRLHHGASESGPRARRQDPWLRLSLVGDTAGGADAYSAQGRYGQLITVVPELHAVIVISSRLLDTAPSIEDHLAMMES